MTAAEPSEEPEPDQTNGMVIARGGYRCVRTIDEGIEKMRAHTVGRSLSVLIAVLTALASVMAIGGRADAEEVKLRGVDVSRYDRGFDFGRDWVAFGFAKASQGTDHVDPTFTRNWRAMKRAGVVRGAYHFAHPNNNPIDEAELFIETVRKRGLEPGDLLVLDLEVDEGRSTRQVNRWAKRWLEHVHEQTGTRPFFYSSWSFAGQHGEGLEEYPLWVAHYGKKPGKVRAPEPWDRWYVHQYAATSHDFNVASVTADELRALGYRPENDPKVLAVPESSAGNVPPMPSLWRLLFPWLS